MFRLHTTARQVGARQEFRPLIILRNPKGQCVSYTAGTRTYPLWGQARAAARQAGYNAVAAMSIEGIHAELARG